MIQIEASAVLHERAAVRGRWRHQSGRVKPWHLKVVLLWRRLWRPSTAGTGAVHVAIHFKWNWTVILQVGNA